MSNILDNKFKRREPAERSHGQVVRTAVMDGKLFLEVRRGIKRVAGIETFLILAVTALDLTVMPSGIRPNELMSDAQLVSRFFKQGRQIAVTVRKTVGKLKTVVRLNALHLDPAACIPRRQLTKKVCRRISRLFCVGSKEPQTAELVIAVY